MKLRTNERQFNMKKEYYTYKESLEVIENFMEKSGLRFYCSNVCVGTCCSGCYESETSCHKNEGRRITCSTYICGRLKSWFILVTIHIKRTVEKTSGSISFDLCDVLNTVSIHINEVISKGLKLPYQHRNTYFTPHTTIIKKCRFDKKIVDLIKSIEINAVRKYVEILLSNTGTCFNECSKRRYKLGLYKFLEY